MTYLVCVRAFSSSLKTRSRFLSNHSYYKHTGKGQLLERCESRDTSCMAWHATIGMVCMAWHGLHPLCMVCMHVFLFSKSPHSPESLSRILHFCIVRNLRITSRITWRVRDRLRHASLPACNQSAFLNARTHAHGVDMCRVSNQIFGFENF